MWMEMGYGLRGTEDGSWCMGMGLRMRMGHNASYHIASDYIKLLCSATRTFRNAFTHDVASVSSRGRQNLALNMAWHGTERHDMK